MLMMPSILLNNTTIVDITLFLLCFIILWETAFHEYGHELAVMSIDCLGCRGALKLQWLV